MSAKTNCTTNPLAAILESVTPSNAIEVMNAAFARGFDVNFKEDKDTSEPYISIEIEIRGEAAQVMSDELDRQMDAQEQESNRRAREMIRLAKRNPQVRMLMNQLRARSGAAPV